MKVRNGFVSNSSSSSFILCGTLIEDLPEYVINKLNALKESGECDEIWDHIFGYDGEVIGESIVYWENYEELDVVKFSEEKITKAKENIKELFKKYLEYDIPDEDVKILAMTYYG